MEWFTRHPDCHRVLASGENKSSIELNNGINVQLWIQPPERFGTLLQFVTGSKEHNVHLRELAQKKNFSLSEQAILDDSGKEMLFTTEEDVYQALGLPYIVPELREDRGEIQAALENHLPNLLKLEDIHSDFHMHTTWSDAANSVKEMALAARALGYHTIAITDHTSGLGIAGGLTVEGLAEQRKDIDAVQKELGNSIRILQGAEVEIKADGSLDYPNEVLAKMDILVASLHTSLRQPRERITERLVNVIRNPHVDIIGHPSGRLLPNREGADLDYDVVLEEAQKSGIVLEINASYSRLDLDEVHARRAAEMGILLAIDADAHTTDQLQLMPFGVSVARRAWVNPGLVINTWSQDKLLSWLTSRG
jgi:DNA polymerase (family 10)